MTVTLRIATRDWDYLTPLLLGDVTSDRLSLQITRVGTLISDLATSADYDAAELSFSRYVSAMAAGASAVVGIPCFIMRGFRHRCVITTDASPLEHFSQLKGKRIGVTGWRDSGNTWTRAALRRDGVGVEDAFWIAGRLTAQHPIVDRLDGFGRPGLIEADPDERPMMEMLARGDLDAIFTPFMPDGFFGPGSGFRQVLRDFRQAECAYYAEVGYVPAHHLVGIKADMLRAHPWIADELTRLLDESQRAWTAKRRKYAETSPFVLDEFVFAGRALAPDWNDSGRDLNRPMIETFARELFTQGIMPAPMTAEALFPGLQ
ncbi:nitrate ABC transporter substrate-binding protein [uncultured Alsobacter sp.]|uniref:nitrate ABC transporter substrate-binding protein n=1 Tax=uncultured Alsobacter sp. TaxID=1748258 RepID=UPI0025ED7B7D|nr:nitrate ABC transporter substrate-binding protein [uncultured Alsobacter sp.]